MMKCVKIKKLTSIDEFHPINDVELIDNNTDEDCICERIPLNLSGKFSDMTYPEFRIFYFNAMAAYIKKTVFSIDEFEEEAKYSYKKFQERSKTGIYCGV